MGRLCGGSSTSIDIRPRVGDCKKLLVVAAIAVTVHLASGCQSSKSAVHSPVISLSLDADLVIGGADSGTAMFGDIRAIGIDTTGRIFIAEAFDNHIRVFNAGGQFLRVLGRYGRGPGEFTGLRGLHVTSSGEVTAYDPVQRRVTVFDSAGSLLSTHALVISSWGFEWDGGLDSEGRLVDAQLRPRPDSGYSTWIRVLDLESGDVEWHPYPDCGIEREPELVHSVGIAGVPFGTGRRTRLDPLGRGTWCGHSARATAYFVPFGSLVPRDSFVSVALPETVSEDERKAAMANLERQVPSLHTVFDPKRIPPVKPLLRAFASDEAGRLWLEIEDSEGTAFHVFSRDARWLARVRVGSSSAPGRQFRVHEGRVYQVSVDSLGVPILRRYPPVTIPD